MSSLFLRKKYSQDAPPGGAPPPAPDAGGGAPVDTSGGVGGPPPGGGGLPPLPGGGGDGSPAAPGAPADDPNDSSKIFYKALSTPQDIVNDYNLVRALNTGKSADEIAQDIWVSYGGDKDGLHVDGWKTGVRDPNEDVKKKDPKKMDQENKITKDAKWKRLERGKNITDIFHDQMQVYKLVLNFTSSEIKAKKPAASVLKFKSWYRYAQNYNKSNY